MLICYYVTVSLKTHYSVFKSLLCINMSKIALSLFDDAKERNLTIWANLSG
jgi:hypothetical protein